MNSVEQKEAMYLYPEDIFEKLEFNKILDIISSSCYSAMGREKVLAFSPESDYATIKDRLEEVDAFLKMKNSGVELPLSNFESITEDIYLLRKDGYILDVESVLRIKNIILQSNDIHAFFGSEAVSSFERIVLYQSRLFLLNNLAKAITRVFDDEGNIKPDASPELQAISRQINSKVREIDKSFRQIASELKQRGMLADSVESFRNGRRVLTVPAENKRKVRGIIHDESATGKTTYIEPESVIHINNELFELEGDRKKEIHRILTDLCATLRPSADEIIHNFEFLISLDVILAKVRFGHNNPSSLPTIENRQTFGIKQAYHPYLFIKNQRENKETVPFDYEMRGKNRVLILSGPNAGGKSVTLKAVGLNQLMLQSGILPFADENSTFGIFKKILCDIGDQQSLDDDLSTYSSRLQNMSAFIKSANKESLILIDEFGSGTDPKIGGAIAEAILKQLHIQGTHGLITTHYSNLKYFAYKSRGILNGGMLYDTENLSPTYELKIGKPGSSFAFEIAQKIGLPKSVLKYARHKTGKNEKAIDQLLVDLQTEKQTIDEKLAELEGREKELDRLIKSYQSLHGELEYRRKKLKLEIKERKLQSVSNQGKALEKLIKNLKDEQNIEKAKEVLKEHKTTKKETVETIQNLKKDVYYNEDFKVEDLRVGDYVKMREGGTTGKILELEKKKAKLAVGDFTMMVPLTELVPANEPVTSNSFKRINTYVARNHNFESNLDIRGYTKADGLAFVQELIDQAMIQNVERVKIVHGVGNGVLKKAVHQKLKEYPEIEKFWHPEDEFGGKGVTYVRL